jgi:hypothetical protein
MKLIFSFSTFLIMSLTSFSQKTDLKDVRARLNKIYYEDQTERMHLPEIQDKFGINSSQLKQFLKKVGAKDSLNLIQIDDILNNYGWLSAIDVGDTASMTIFLVIQHSNLANRLKYLPVMRDAVKKGKAKAKHLALLEDRVALEQGKKQIYGSQIGFNIIDSTNYVLPLEDPENVDKRRSAVGLEPIAEYVAYWDIIWNIQDYMRHEKSSTNTPHKN